MNNEQAIADLSLPEGAKRQLTMVWLKIILLPIIIFVLAALGGEVGLKIGIVPLVCMGVILFFGLIFARHSAELGCCAFEQRSEDFKKELKQYIVKNLLIINKEQKSNADFDAFAARYACEVRDKNFSSTGAAVFALLGILGTFISVAVALPSLSSLTTNAIIAADTASLNDIGVMLDGVAGAFYVCAFGIFMSLWWIFFERLGVARFERLIARQKKATASFFWSQSEIQQKYTEYSLNSFEKIGQVFDYVSKYEFFEGLEKAIDRKYTNFSTLLQTESDAVRLSGEHLKQTMSTLIKSNRDQKDIVKTHSDIVNALNLFNAQLKELQFKMSENYARLQSASDDKISRLDKSVDNLNGVLAGLKDTIGSFGEGLLGEQKAALADFRAAITDGMGAFRGAFDEEAVRDYRDLGDIEKFKSDSANLQEQTENALKSLKLEEPDEK